MDLRDVDWMVDDEDCLVPGSICDREYLEQAFEGSQAYFLKMIGSLNAAEMDHRLVDAPRTRVLDVELQKDAEELSRKWFGTGLAELSQERKLRRRTGGGVTGGGDGDGGEEGEGDGDGDGGG